MIIVMRVKINKTKQMLRVVASFALLIGLASCSSSSPLPNGQADLVKIADGKIVKVVDGDTVDIDI